MAVIHKTTLNPGKLELLAAWLPAQPWYLGRAGAPRLARAGGFRLDDPLGQVGIEFAIVNDQARAGVTTYLVPMTYRGAAGPDADGALIGTTEHGVLGHRWVYDGLRDPVLVAQLVAFIQGETQAQAQAISHTPDPTVTSQPAAANIFLAVTGSAHAADESAGTELVIQTADASGSRNGTLTIGVSRVLRPDGTESLSPTAQPCLFAYWDLPDSSRAHGVLAAASFTPA